jgi:hypothetical protein
MRIKTVTPNNRKKAFEVTTRSKRYWFPYAQLELRPLRQDPVKRVYVDKEIGSEGFTYELASGKQDTVHIDHVLEYNRDPGYMRDQLLYRLTLLAQQQVKNCSLSKRELIRRLGTSPAQFYRLLDQTNYTKSINQLVCLLTILDCDLDLVVRGRPARFGRQRERFMTTLAGPRGGGRVPSGEPSAGGSAQASPRPTRPRR